MKPLSIGIALPVLNEARRIEAGVQNTLHFLESLECSEFVVTIADNGSTDKTPELGQALAAQHAAIRYLRLPAPGVGAALKHAWRDMDCDLIGAMDIDLAVPLPYLRTMYHELASNDNISMASGSRYLPGAVVSGRQLRREISSRGLNLLMQRCLSAGFTDAMCGCQLIRKSAFEEISSGARLTDGWFFTAELMVRCEWLGLAVKEIPVQWIDGGDSRVRLFYHSAQFLGEIFRLRREKPRESPR